MLNIKKLHLLRKHIEKIDCDIIKLLNQRFITTNKIQLLKRQLGIKTKQNPREISLIKKYLNLAKRTAIPLQLIKQVFPLIFSYSKKTGIIKR